tara:strand:+ start:192 stop:611 length:420 start_codon:yes stop_codon:yes gene_type:complete
MTENKPLVVKIIIGIILLKLTIILLTIGLFYLTKDLDPTTITAMTGIRDGIIEKFNLNSTGLEYEFGRLIGKLLIPAILAILTLTFVVNRKFWFALIVVSLDFMFGLSQGFPLLTIVILIMILTNPTRNYLKNTNPNNT